MDLLLQRSKALVTLDWTPPTHTLLPTTKTACRLLYLVLLEKPARNWGIPRLSPALHRVGRLWTGPLQPEAALHQLLPP